MTDYPATFLSALSITLGHEGSYSADKSDPGGQTFCGISRVYWPMWPGWPKVDKWLANGGQPPDLTLEIREFYYVNFWCRFQGNVISEISPEIAKEMFDTAVNLDVSDAVRFLQTALNMQNNYQKAYSDIEVDGKLARDTITTLRRYLSMQPGSRVANEQILLNCMNGEQYIHYKNNPRHERYRGWFARV